MHYLFALLFFVPVAGRLEVVEEKKPKTVKEYREAIAVARNWADNIDNRNYYKDFTFKHNDTNKVKKFIELDEFQKRLFMLMQFEKITQTMEFLNTEFSNEMKEFFKPNDPLDMTTIETSPVKKGNIDAFLKELHKMRSEVAKKYEAYTADFFKQFKSNFTVKEMDQYLKSIKDYHKENNLN